MTKSEKRYFKLFCQRESSGNNYLKLFDAIDQQDKYDEAAIREQFQGEKFVKQLHVTKNYLRKAILKSLRNYHAEVSMHAELKDVLRNVEILYHKELYELSLRELKKAEQIARDYELLTGLVEVEGWKRKLTQVLQPYQYKTIQQALDARAEAIKLLQNKNEYWRVATQVTSSLFNDDKITKNNPLLENPDRALTLEAKVLYYSTNYLRYLQKRENEKAGKALKTLVGLLEEKQKRIDEDPDLYVSSINNLVSYLVFTRQYGEALGYIQKAKDLYDRWTINSANRTLIKQMLRTLNIELEIFRLKKMFNEQPAFIESTQAFVRANQNKMPREYLISFWFQFASIHFMQGDFKRSQQWINRMLNAKYDEIRIDLQVQTRMLNLMVHLEQQNLMVLRHYVDSTRRYLKKVKEVQPFEKILMRFFIKIGRLPLLEYRTSFRELKEQLFPEESDPLIPQDILRYIDYREWIDGKLNVQK